jgi:Holliday junction resolvasome RuvABC endonuclease subunit
VNGTTQVVLGVDPGEVSGWALVTVGPDPRLIAVGSLAVHGGGGLHAQATALVRQLDMMTSDPQFACPRAIIEDQYLARGEKENVRALTSLARMAGRWTEFCLTWGLDVERVQASRWQADVLGKGLGVTARAESAMRKLASVGHAQRLWPRVAVEWDEHAADAALMARWSAVEQYVAARQPLARISIKRQRMPGAAARSRKE